MRQFDYTIVGQGLAGSIIACLLEMLEKTVAVVKVDNQPIVGVHPLHSRIAVFNGLGSKGVLQAPFAALQLIAYLEEGEPIHPDFDVCRKSLWK